MIRLWRVKLLPTFIKKNIYIFENFYRNILI